MEALAPYLSLVFCVLLCIVFFVGYLDLVGQRKTLDGLRETVTGLLARSTAQEGTIAAQGRTINLLANAQGFDTHMTQQQTPGPGAARPAPSPAAPAPAERGWGAMPNLTKPDPRSSAPVLAVPRMRVEIQPGPGDYPSERLIALTDSNGINHRMRVDARDVDERVGQGTVRVEPHMTDVVRDRILVSFPMLSPRPAELGIWVPRALVLDPGSPRPPMETSPDSGPLAESPKRPHVEPFRAPPPPSTHPGSLDGGSSPISPPDATAEEAGPRALLAELAVYHEQDEARPPGTVDDEPSIRVRPAPPNVGKALGAEGPLVGIGVPARYGDPPPPPMSPAIGEAMSYDVAPRTPPPPLPDASGDGDRPSGEELTQVMPRPRVARGNPTLLSAGVVRPESPIARVEAALLGPLDPAKCFRDVGRPDLALAFERMPPGRERLAFVETALAEIEAGRGRSPVAVSVTIPAPPTTRPAKSRTRTFLGLAVLPNENRPEHDRSTLEMPAPGEPPRSGPRGGGEAA